MEYRGPWPDLDIPDITLYDLLFSELSAEDTDRVAFDHAESGTRVTFGQVKHDVDAVATWLASRGIGPGAVVAVMLRNRAEYAAAFHGILRAGATITPVAAIADAGDLARQLDITDACLVITEPESLERVRHCLTSRGLGDDAIVLMDAATLPEAEASEGIVRWEELVGTAPNPPQLDIDPATHHACLPMTSGTSGLPKAAALTHRNLVANILQYDPILGDLDADASMIVFLPYSHIYALTTQLNIGLLRHITQHTMSQFTAHLFFELITTRRPTILYVVPAVATMLSRIAIVDTIDWTPVKYLITGAAPLDIAVAEKIEQRLGVQLIQGLGMTETSPATIMTCVQHPEWPLDAVGRPVANTVVRLVNPETGEDVPPAEPGQWSAPGELWIQGPQVMAGYLHNQEATDQVIVDGWLHSGDLVQANEDGIMRVVGRTKELIKRNGQQIAPGELEAILLRHPTVEDSAVAGIRLSNGEEVPMALLVIPGGGDAELAEVLRWYNAQVASYKHISRARLVESLPRSGAGKLLRRDLEPLLV